MKKALSTIFVISLVCFFFMPKIIHAAAFTTFTVNNPVEGAIYNPGDTIVVSGTVTSAVCYNSVNSIPVTFILGGSKQVGVGNMDARGGTQLEWYDKITLPPASEIPCGANTLNIHWVQPVYNKTTGALTQTDVGDVTIHIQIGQPGVCGTANGVTSSNAPINNLCSTGIASNVADAGNYWKWKCTTAGVCLGDTLCQAPKTSVAAACGTNGTTSGKSYPVGSTTFSGTFCADNATPTPATPIFPTAELPTTTWTCPGSPSITCKAILSTSGSCQ